MKCFEQINSTFLSLSYIITEEMYGSFLKGQTTPIPANRLLDILFYFTLSFIFLGKLDVQNRL